MKKVILVCLLTALVFGLYSSQQSQSISVVSVDRVGDRLLTNQELNQIVSQAEPLAIPVDFESNGVLYGVTTLGHYQAIVDQVGTVYYHTRDPLEVIAGSDGGWLISKRTVNGDELIRFDPRTSEESVITTTSGETLRRGIVWGGDIFIESSSPARGNLIYRYRVLTRSLEVFVENGFEPKLYRNRLHYLYQKGDQLGFESVNLSGNDLQSFVPAYGDIYSYFFQGDEIDLLSHTKQQDQNYFLRIRDALGSSQAENFGYFDARFQTDQLIFGTNGFHDSLLLEDMLIQIPKDMTFHHLLDDMVYFTYRQMNYRIPVHLLEEIVSRY